MLEAISTFILLLNMSLEKFCTTSYNNDRALEEPYIAVNLRDFPS